MNDQILQEISEFCRQRGLAESTFGRRAVNDGKLANRLRNGGRITTDTLRAHPQLHGAQRRCRAGAPPHAVRCEPARGLARGHAAGAAGRLRAGGQRPATQFPLLRQPAEISAVREYLQREMGNRQSRRHGARQHPSAPAGGARVRRRPRRRHRAGARHAQYARPLSHHAVLYRRQGNQPRRHPPHAAQDGRPFRRASLDRAGAHQSRLCRSALAGGEVAVRRHQPGVEGNGDGRQHRALIRAADHRARAVFGRELEGARVGQERQPGL